jgi:hypothetical protein
LINSFKRRDEPEGEGEEKKMGSEREEAKGGQKRE